MATQEKVGTRERIMYASAELFRRQGYTGTGVKQITDVPAGSRLWEASWTPDGTRILADWESNRIGVFVDPDTGETTTINGQIVMTHPGLRPIP